MCMIRWIGAMCVVGACGACGFSMAASYRGLEKNLQQLGNALELMECQMEYRLTELPELCSILASACTGAIGQIFAGLGRQLQSGLAADAAACMNLTLEKYPDLPKACRDVLWQLGTTLGQLDLQGQLRGLAAAKESVRQTLAKVQAEKSGRLRCYQALGLCGGAALAILFL